METNTAGTQKKIDQLSQTAQETVERATSAASQMAGRFAEKGEELLAMKDNWVETTRDYVREHPIQAVGIAVAAGYLLSMIMRSSK